MSLPCTPPPVTPLALQSLEARELECSKSMQEAKDTKARFQVRHMRLLLLM